MKSILKHLSDLKVSGARIIGCRRSGKSFLAETLRRKLSGNVQVFDASSLARSNMTSFGSLPSGDTNSSELFDREIEARLRSGTDLNPLNLIVDNAEFLLVHLSDAIVSRIHAALTLKALRLVLIRNRFIREEHGWMANRELPLADVLPKFELNPLDRDESIALASYFFRSDNRNRQQRAIWLAEWSGGLPGLMFDLKPLAPLNPPADDVSDRLLKQIERVGRDIGSDIPIRRTVIEAATFQYLPPYPLLHSLAQEEVGYLMWIGMLKPLFSTERIPFQGKFWSAIAEKSTNAITPRFNDYTRVSLRLEEFLVQAQLASQLAEELGCSSVDDLSTVFEKSLVASNNTQLPAIGIGRFLADSLGRSGLRRVLRAAGHPVDQNTNMVDLTTRLMSLAEEL